MGAMFVINGFASGMVVGMPPCRRNNCRQAKNNQAQNSVKNTIHKKTQKIYISHRFSRNDTDIFSRFYPFDPWPKKQNHSQVRGG